MTINDARRFDEFAQSCGNRYLAVKVIARWARDLGEQLSEYRISESKLIEIVLNGKYYSDAELAQRRLNNDSDHIEDLLECVLDDRIVEEVKRLYKQSIKHRKLQSCNNLLFTKGERSKVNILLKILWYSIK